MSLEILQKYHIRAKKSLGQNFLVNEEKVQEIAHILPVFQENILEVGPGYGALTEKLLVQKPKGLHLVELDRDMISILEERISLGELELGETDFQIFHKDVLHYTPEFIEYSVIANIPYYITSPILHHFLYGLDNPPKNMVILMQKDVGDKILGGKKNKSSVIKLMIEKKCQASEKVLVPKESFIPVPKVESSVLLFELHEKYKDIDDTLFLQLIKKGFAEPRKKCIKNLIKGGYSENICRQYIEEQGYDDNFRGEDGSIDFWVGLYKTLV